jgi:hypothetical protein
MSKVCLAICTGNSITRLEISSNQDFLLLFTTKQSKAKRNLKKSFNNMISSIKVFILIVSRYMERLMSYVHEWPTKMQIRI